MKRIFKGPWVWIGLAVVGVILALQYIAPGGGYDEVSTSRGQQYIADGQVEKIKFIDGDQKIEIDLVKGTRDSGDKVMTSYVLGQQQGIIARPTRSRRTAAASRTPRPRTRSPACSARSWRPCCRSR